MRKMFALVSVFLSVLSAVPCFSAEAKVYHDEDLREVIHGTPELKRSHSVMMRQRKRLHEVLDSFLGGNLEEVNRLAAELSSDMKEVATDYLPQTDMQVEAWKAMALIVNQSTGLEEATKKRDYRTAQERYYNIISHCMHCHQSVRDWGKLPEEEVKALEESAPTPTSEQTPETNNA